MPFNRGIQMSNSTTGRNRPYLRDSPRHPRQPHPLPRCPARRPAEPGHRPGGGAHELQIVGEQDPDRHWWGQGQHRVRGIHHQATARSPADRGRPAPHWSPKSPVQHPKFRLSRLLSTWYKPVRIWLDVFRRV
jgi:hypothetical protein